MTCAINVNEKVVKSYQKATAQVVRFSNEDIITTSGGNNCESWSNQNGVSCHFNLTAVY